MQLKASKGRINNTSIMLHYRRLILAAGLCFIYNGLTSHKPVTVRLVLAY
ncbi:hypothetical protein [Methyloglobulus sp.]